MEKVFGKITKVILVVITILTITSIFSNTFAATKIYTNKLNKGDKLEFTATAWYIYKTKEAAKNLNTSYTKRFMQHGEKFTIQEIDGNVLKIKDDEYIHYGSTGSKHFKKISSAAPEKIKVTGVKFNDTKKVEMAIGNEKTFAVTVLPKNAENKNVKFSVVDSAKKDLITLDAKTGKVKALKAGTLKIRVTTEDGNFKADKEIVIKDNTKISFEKTQEVVNYVDGLTVDFASKLKDVNGRKIEWTNTNEELGKIDSNGKWTIAKDRRTGTTTITARVKDNTKIYAKCKLTVVSSNEQLEEVKIEIKKEEPKNNKIKVKETLELKAEVVITPEDSVAARKSANKKIKWESKNTKIAKVDSKGVVTGISAGKTTIVATSIINDKAVAKFEIEVLAPTLKGLKEKAEVDVGKIINLGEKIETDPKGLKITYKSSNTKIATVDKNGVVKGVKAGTATITAQVEGGEKKNCKVTVIQRAKAIKTDKTKYEIVKGKTVTIAYTLTPTNAQDDKVAWTVKDEKIAKITADSHKNHKIKLEGIKAGETQLIGKVGDAKITLKITVAPPVQSVALNHTSATITAGNTLQLKATVKPETADNKKVTWSSSNTSAATVDANGKVTAKNVTSKQTTTITVKTVEGGKTAKCKIQVNPKVVTTKTVTTSSIVKVGVKNSLQAPTKEQLLYVINNSSIIHGDRRTNAKANIDYFMYIQDTYKVNALFALAVATQESAVGTSSLAKSHNNWYGVRSGNGWRYYNSPADSIKGFGSLIAGNTYFGNGKIAINTIGKTYCEGNTWPAAVAGHMQNFYKLMQ